MSGPQLTSRQVLAMVAAMWPDALRSPLAQAMHSASSMAMLEASDADAVIELAEIRADAMQHAQACLRARDGWTVETLGHNIESAFGCDLEPDVCDEIARTAIALAEGRP